MNDPQCYYATIMAGVTPVAKFRCEPGLSVLRAALNAGLELSAGCMQGRCRMCRSALEKGQVISNRPQSKYATIDPADLGDGTVLLCSVSVLSDIEITPGGPWRIIESRDGAEPHQLLAPEHVPEDF